MQSHVHHVCHILELVNLDHLLCALLKLAGKQADNRADCSTIVEYSVLRLDTKSPCRWIHLSAHRVPLPKRVTDVVVCRDYPM